MEKWLEWAQQMQAIAQAGLTYARDVYDQERYQQLRQLSIEIMSEYTQTEMNKLTELFASETGYPTPKVDIRAVVFREGKLLMIREKSDNGWALPGGWADIGLSPAEIAVKETREESGFEVRPIKLLAALDKKHFPHPPEPFYTYKLFIQCEITGGEALMTTTETSDLRFFALEEFPFHELSVARNTESQIRMMFDHLSDPKKAPDFN